MPSIASPGQEQSKTNVRSFLNPTNHVFTQSKSVRSIQEPSLSPLENVPLVYQVVQHLSTLRNECIKLIFGRLDEGVFSQCVVFSQAVCRLCRCSKWILRIFTSVRVGLARVKPLSGYRRASLRRVAQQVIPISFGALSGGIRGQNLLHVVQR